MAEIYIHIPGGEQLSIVPEASSSQDWALMGDNKLSLSFQRYECSILPAGAWCEFDGVIFYLLQEYKPTMIHSHLWQYNVAFVDGASWLGVTTALKTIDGEDAPLFTLTAPAAEHAAIIVSNVNRRLGTTVWEVGSVIDTPNITIEYTGKYCGAVLQEIVDGQNTEWWVDGTTLNIGRAEFGSLIELGYRDGLLGDITVTQADNMSSYRTLYPVGSTRNILPTEYGHDRLQLPNGQKSVMMNPAGVAELVEEAAFAGIYPRYKGKVTGVSTSIGQSNDGSQYLIYIVADTAIPFNPNDYEMPGLVKHITFQSGELMGAEFEVNYNPASNEFELITQFQENGSQLPGGMLIPQVGDEYVVWNISMPAEYYPLAEQELLEAAESFAAASTRESNVYKVKLDYIDVQERGLSLRPGQKVRLHSVDYFPEQGYYDSRITRVTRPVNYPGEYTIDVSAVRVVGSLTRLQTSLAAATTKVNSLSNTVQTVVQTVSNAVTLTGNQRVRGVKDFVDGVKIGGLPLYPINENTVFLDANIVFGGAATMFGKDSTTFPPIWANIPFNPDDFSWDGSQWNFEGSTSGGGGGTGGGISIADLEYYLTTNGWATQDWVTGKGFITGITSSMVTNALGYTPVAVNTGLTSADNNAIGYGYVDGGWPEAGSAMVFGVGNYKAGVHVGASGSAIRYGYTAGTTSFTWRTILDDNNYSDYALPKDGTAVAANGLVEEVVTDLNNATAGRIFTMTSGYGSTAGNKPTKYWVTGITLAYAHNSSFRRQLAFADAKDESLYLRAEHIGVWGEWSKILTSSNFYDYALPLTGGKINGDLEVAGCLYSSRENLRIRAKGASMTGVEIAVSDTDYWQISHRGAVANNELHFYHNANGTWSNSVLSLMANGDVATGGNLLAKGAITMYYSSDKRLKQNIRKINASEVLMSLGGIYQYEYIDSEVAKNSTYGGSHFGLIYQNVKGTALDKMCFEREDGMGALNYLDTNFISLIAGATMENCTEIEKLKKENKALRKRVEQLEKRIA